MAEIPRAVLSEHFEQRLQNRRLVAAVFLTFRFDPEFFEHEILPVFLNVPVSHAAAIKLVQLEDALRSVPGGVAVYYDQNGLVPEGGPAKLDVQRIAVRHRSGIFHPKNVFALLEGIEPDELGHRSRTLLVAAMSANLTRAGWWENVEVCHVEEIGEGDPTRLREDVIGVLRRIEQSVGNKASDQAALREIRGFVLGSESRQHKSSGGVLHTHFFDGRGSIADFLADVAGGRLHDSYLEVISPYFDRGPEPKPLLELIQRFNPREVRVCLPRNNAGEALCSPELFEWVREQRDVHWARLPSEVTRVGKKDDDAAQRMIHAKVYRFFMPSPKREVLFIGSPNLTQAAHFNGGNFETGFLVELSPARRPDWWLITDVSRPRTYAARTDEGTSTVGGSRLSIRFNWARETAEGYWDDPQPSPVLTLSYQNVPLFTIDSLPSREWRPLSPDRYSELRRVLASTSILTVSGDRPEPGLILVQEEGMEDRPSLLFDLSPAEILRYWSLLTAAQRAQFLEGRAQDALLSGQGGHLVTPYRPIRPDETFFDRFAGIFLAFGSLERSVRSALREGRDREATYRLFGQKYDSLGNLLRRIVKDAEEGRGDLVEHYVMALSAHQLVQECRREHPEFWGHHHDQARELAEGVKQALAIRDRVSATDPDRMPAFLDWFEGWFLKRAKPVEVETT